MAHAAQLMFVAGFEVDGHPILTLTRFRIRADKFNQAEFAVDVGTRMEIVMVVRDKNRVDQQKEDDPNRFSGFNGRHHIALPLVSLR